MVENSLEITNEKVKDLLYSIKDPEIPVLSILDMGIVKSVVIKDNFVDIKITPTYSGCPAMDTIAADIKKALIENGFETKVTLVLAPAWTTDDINEAGRTALEEYGIAAPLNKTLDKAALLHGEKVVKCTNCKSTNTELISQFGSTPCKALFKCLDCLEPFDYFKCLT